MNVTAQEIESLRLNHNTAILDMSAPGFLDQACSYMQIGPCGHLKAIIDFARNNLGALTAVVEREYVDADFLHDYGEFYCRAFSPPPSKCGRLHLFSCAGIGREHLLSLADFQNSYLGYVVVRPTGSTAVGRTCLKCRPMTSDREYLLCEHPFPVHINGSTLTVQAFPFITQDTNTFVCAGAAMWVQAYYMHERFHFPRFYPAQITREAMRYSVAGNVRTGLSFAQMGTALRDMGYNPHVYTYLLDGLPTEAKERALRRAVLTGHATVESRLPCIFGIDFRDPSSTTLSSGHAITAIGHSFEQPDASRVSRFLAPGQPDDAFSGALFNGDWVSWFVVHDDQDVPYGRLWTWDKPPEAPERQFCLAKDIRSLVILIPMPREVALEFHHAVMWARKAFSWWKYCVEQVLLDRAKFRANWPGYGEVSEEWRIAPDADVVWRVYLEPSEDYKVRVMSTTMHEDFKKALQAMTFPRYVWVAEMASRSRLNAPKEVKRTVKGEVVLDATSNPSVTFPPILAFQYKGRFACCPSHLLAPMMLYRKGDHEEYSPGQRGTTTPSCSPSPV
ncbi:MAG: hypothetical protein NTX87_09235 [Planctomycetota bacterium]|nr:hypothetical protein [Planctomycetota bacterium]